MRGRVCVCVRERERERERDTEKRSVATGRISCISTNNVAPIL